MPERGLIILQNFLSQDAPCLHDQEAIAQVREARAEAEAAAEQRLATALEQQRVELVKQARSWLCTCGNGGALCTALACPVQTLYATHCECGCCACHACGSIGHVCTGGLRCMQAPVPIMLCHALLIENVRLGVASTH